MEIACGQFGGGGVRGHGTWKPEGEIEPLIYSRPIHMISADRVNLSKDDCDRERSMSLSYFQNVTSRKGLARRAWI
jgi:hypothetical protein